MAQGNYTSDLNTEGKAASNLISNASPFTSFILVWVIELFHWSRNQVALSFSEASTKKWFTQEVPNMPPFYAENGEFKNPAVG